jgi:hypothetical protein
MSSSSSEISFSVASDARTEATIGPEGIEINNDTTKGYVNEVDKRRDRMDQQSSADDGNSQGSGDADDTDGLDGDGESSQGTGDEQTDGTTTLTDIESFDPEDPENLEAWNKEYVKEDGFLNIDRISSEFWRNVDGGGEGLNEATYEFLASKGISKEDAKKYEAMAINDRDFQKSSVSAHDQELFTVAGGPDTLRLALDWGKEGAYSEDQRKKFDKIMQGKDLDAKKEAVELLIARFQKSDAFKAKQEADRKANKPTDQRRDATKGQGTPKGDVKPFKDRAEWRAARKAAGDDTTKLRLVDARAKVSSF